MIKLICFDIDDTLMDFHKGEKVAFYEAMKDLQVEVSEHEYRIYEKINEQLWKKLEMGEIEKDALRVLRFAQLKEVAELAYDEHQANVLYVKHLSEQCFLIEGSVEVVKACAKIVPLAAATNGIAAVQRSRLNKSGLADYFKYLFISEDMGYAKPHPLYFKKIFEEAKVQPHEVLFVGDSLSADIAGAVASGCKSVWVNPKHLMNTTSLQSDYEIERLEEVLDILEELR